MTIVAGRGARALCDALARDRMTVERRGAGLIVKPGALVGPELLAQLTRYKAELLGALNRAAARCVSTELLPCPCCDAEFLAGGELRCPWCQAAGWGSDGFSTATRTVPGQFGHLAYANSPDVSDDLSSLTSHQDS